MKLMVKLVCMFAVLSLTTSSAIADSESKDSGTIAQATWVADGQNELQVEFLKKANPAEDESPRELVFLNRKTGEELYKEDCGDSFVGMYPTSDGFGRFVVVTMGGSAYHFNVYTFQGGKVKNVLNTGSYWMLGMHYTSSGQQCLDVYEVQTHTKLISVTSYTWDGSKYVGQTERR
jgi:hypothetical protein